MYSTNPNRSESSDLNATLIYYPEEHDYSMHYEHQAATPHRSSAKASKMPTINYFNERKCPIYVHEIEKDSSVYNNYNQKLATQKRTEFSRKAPPNNSKFVLDKLEETYWATWKPKKDSPRPNFNVPDYSRPRFQHNKGFKHFNSLRDDGISDDVIKYFKAERFDSSSYTDSTLTNEKKFSPILLPKKSNVIKRQTVSNQGIKSDKQDEKFKRPTNSRQIKMVKNECQEIQTEVHFPIILEKTQLETNIDNTEPESKIIEEADVATQSTSKNKIATTETNDNKEENEANSQDTSSTPFVEHKDSIEVIRKQQSEPKDHFQQPKCIKLYRKSGSAAGYIRGGTYPLKSCLKNYGGPKGNFKLGPPGSPLFVTTSSGKRK